MRIIISHPKYPDAQVTLTIDPTNKSERNHVRAVLRRAERGKLAGRNE